MNARIPLFAAALAAAVAIAAPTFVAPAFAEMTKMVGGAPMYPSKNIIENAVNSKDHTTLVAAVKAAGLVDTPRAPAPSPSSRQPTRPSPVCPPARSRRC